MLSGTDSGCGSPQDLSASAGSFSSVNYPNNYDNGKSCSWHITVDPDKVTKHLSPRPPPRIVTFATGFIVINIIVINNVVVVSTKMERMWFFGSSSAG